MKIAVIGGAGYIGSKLVPHLVEQGHDVTVYDLLWFEENTLPVSVHKIDALQLTEVDFEGIDAVIFLGGLSSDPMAAFAPHLNYVSNASAVAHTAYVAKQAGVKRYIYASSCSVYGFAPDKDYTEEDKPKAEYPYGVSKLQGETALFQLADDNFTVVSLRKGTVSGTAPMMRWDLLVNTMYTNAKKLHKITVRNAGLWRPVLDIDDAVQAYTLALENGSGIYNIASFNTTILDVAKKVAEWVPEADIEVLDETEMRNYRADWSKAERELGYKPKGSLESILNQLIKIEPGDTSKHLDLIKKAKYTFSI